MIESEEKRKRLTETITRWSKHTKVDHLLRQGDILSLVRQILNEFYHITLSCGHMVAEMDERIDICYKDYSDGEEVEMSGGVCKECAEWYKKEAGAWETTKE